MPSRSSKNAYDKGDKLPVITDNIEAVELEMGTRCAFELYICHAHAIHDPELEIRHIGKLAADQFRGIFTLHLTVMLILCPNQGSGEKGPVFITSP